MDLDPVHFVLLGVEQDRFAHAAGIIHGISSVLRMGGASKTTPAGGASTTLRPILRVIMILGSRLCLVPKQEFGCYCATVHAFEAVNGEVRAGLMGRDNRGL